MHAHIHALITTELQTLGMLYQALFLHAVTSDLAVQLKERALDQISRTRNAIEGILDSTTQYIENDSDKRLANLARDARILSSGEVPEEMKDEADEMLANVRRRQHELPKELSEEENIKIKSIRESYAPMHLQLNVLEKKFKLLFY